MNTDSTVQPSRTVVLITVEGDPKPKGSLKHVGRGQLVEQVKGSGTWRAAVAWAARATYRGRPIDGPAGVDFEIRVQPPKSSPKGRVTLPATRSSGDLDKHARNILDALVDGGVLHDDSRVVRLSGRKRHCRPGETPGALIEARAITDLTEVDS